LAEYDMRGILGSIAVLLACSAAHAADAPPAVFGAWTFDATLSKNTDAGDATATHGSGARPADQGHSRGAGGRHGGGMGGGMGSGAGGGMGGGGGAHGGGGGGHHAGPSSNATHAGSAEVGAEQRERGLERLFATKLTISTAAQRIRFDDGEHPIELGTDGMNVSGPGVGGTVALTATAPEFVIETLTDTGYALQEHYRSSDDGAHLELHASLKRPGSDESHDSVRVFDRVPAATGKNAAPPPAR
jgi:hypothetical protein